MDDPTFADVLGGRIAVDVRPVHLEARRVSFLCAQCDGQWAGTIRVYNQARPVVVCGGCSVVVSLAHARAVQPV